MLWLFLLVLALFLFTLPEILRVRLPAHQQALCCRASLKNKDICSISFLHSEKLENTSMVLETHVDAPLAAALQNDMSLGIAYLAINPTHWIRPLGLRSLYVCVSIWLYTWAHCDAESCPLLPIAFDVGWPSSLQQIPRCRNLVITVVHWLGLGLPRWCISKGQICAQFSKAGLFLLICRPGGKTDTGLLAFLFCFVLFLCCNLNELGNWIRWVKNSG